MGLNASDFLVIVAYLLAATFLFLCAMGPEPRFLGHRILYEPPYAWLMRLPVFAGGVRVPARFAMLGALALSVAAYPQVDPNVSVLAYGMVVLSLIVQGGLLLPVADLLRLRSPGTRR